jgi:hypothetical protein
MKERHVRFFKLSSGKEVLSLYIKFQSIAFLSITVQHQILFLVLKHNTLMGYMAFVEKVLWKFNEESLVTETT